MAKQKISQTEARRRAHSAAAARGTSYSSELATIQTTFDVSASSFDYSSGSTAGCDPAPATYTDSTPTYSDPGC